MFFFCGDVSGEMFLCQVRRPDDSMQAGLQPTVPRLVPIFLLYSTNLFNQLQLWRLHIWDLFVETL